MWRYHKLIRCFGKVTLGLLWIFMLSIFWNIESASAAPVITVEMQQNVNLDIIPDQFKSVDFPVTVTTNSSNGYNLFLYTAGSTTNMINITNPEFVIPTITLPAGATSVPASSVSGGYAYSADGANFKPAPSPASSGDLVSEMPNVTPNEPNVHTVTFGAKVGTDVRAGDYKQTFIFRVVANNPDFCGSYSICYYGNEDDGTGVMEDQSASSNSKVTLVASNYSRAGYGFAGWNTEPDGWGTNYGPSQAIQTGDLSGSGLKLYANWVASAGNLQDWTGCPAMTVGSVTALTDTRDGNTYAVAKLADGKCWMIENLRLDLSKPSVNITIANTNNPAPDFVTAVANHPTSTNDFCAQETSACLDQVKFNSNNTDRRFTADYTTNDNQSSWYSYGHYYNWYTGTAGRGTSKTTVTGATAGGDICPSGWRLPSAYNKTDDFGALDVALGGTGLDQTTDASSEKYRAYPNNFIYAGEQRTGTAYNRNVSGSYTSASMASGTRINNLWLRPAAVSSTNNTTYKYRGQVIRCIAKEQFTEASVIHYEPNGGTGEIPDEEFVDFSVATAEYNYYTRTGYEFVSWNTKADGTGTVVAEGGALLTAATSMGVEDGDTLTLYAIWRPIFNIVYSGNGADAGSMSSITHSNVGPGTKISLVPSNYSRSGYGFAGWSIDPNAGTKLKNGQSVTVYGPNQSITLNNAFLSNVDSNNNITLYAVWVPPDSSGNNRTMQTFNSSSCAAMSTGSVTALVDVRDNNTYAVTKLADGHCWMMENLRLVPSSTTFSSSNTNNPTTNFISEASSSSSSNTLCNSNTADCFNQIQLNTNDINRSLTASYNKNATNVSWYSYGVKYNWYTATAGNGTYSVNSGTAAGDICPNGWRLPTGGTGGEFSTLTSKNSIMNFPANFILSGDYNNKIPGGRGTFGRWWSATPNGDNAAYRLGINNGASPTPTGSWNKWDGFAVRCIVQ